MMTKNNNLYCAVNKKPWNDWIRWKVQWQWLILCEKQPFSWYGRSIKDIFIMTVQWKWLQLDEKKQHVSLLCQSTQIQCSILIDSMMKMLGYLFMKSKNCRCSFNQNHWIDWARLADSLYNETWFCIVLSIKTTDLIVLIGNATSMVDFWWKAIMFMVLSIKTNKTIEFDWPRHGNLQMVK